MTEAPSFPTWGFERPGPFNRSGWQRIEHPDCRGSNALKMRAFLGAWTMAVTLLSGCTSCDDHALGEVAPSLVVSPTLLEWREAYVGAPEIRTIYLENVGTAPVRITGLQFSGSPDFGLRSPLEAFDIFVGAKVTVDVVFTPASEGLATGNVLIEHRADDAPRLQVGLIGSVQRPLDCADNNPCTTEGFDPTQKDCVVENVDSPCDDDSVCTREDRCLDGVCVGQAVPCQADTCSLGVCESLRGCLQVPDPEACADNNPCTADLCDPETGCANEWVSDGTECPGQNIQCQIAHACFRGNCIEVTVPDGASCSDGQMCTVDDLCKGGQCTGTWVDREQELIGTGTTFGGSTVSRAVALSEERVLFADAHPLNLAVAEVGGGSMQLVAQTQLPRYRGVGRLYQVDQDRVVTMAAQRSASRSLLELRVRSDGAVQQLRTARLGPNIHRSSCGPAGVSGEVFYFCDDVELRTFDLVSWTEQPPIELGARCQDLAVDPNGTFLVVAHNQGLVRFELTDPLAPSLSVERLFGWTDAVATDGAIIVAHEGITAETLRILNSRTLAELASHPGDEIEGLEYTAAGFVALRYLTGQTQEVFEIWDFGDPNAPRLLGSEHRTEDVVGGSFGCRLTNVSHDFLFVGGQDALQVRKIQPGATPAFVPLTAPAHGRMRLLASDGSEVHAMHRNSARAIDVSDPAYPRFVSGGVNQLTSYFYSMSPGGALPTTPISDRYSGPGRWTDVSNPDAPIFLGSLGLAPEHGRVVYPRDGLLYSFSYPSGQPHRFEVFDLSRLSPGTPHLNPIGNVVLPASLNPAFVGLDPTRIAVDGSRAVVGVNNRDATVRTLIVLDVSDPAAPAVRSQTRTLQLIDELALAGDRIAILESERSSVNGLRIFDFVADVPVERGYLSLDGGVIENWKILGFDGTVLIVGIQNSTRTRVAFFDAEAVPPTLIGDLGTGDSPQSAAVVQDHLLVATHSKVHTIYPPCPPRN